MAVQQNFLQALVQIWTTELSTFLYSCGVIVGTTCALYLSSYQCVVNCVSMSSNKVFTRLLNMYVLNPLHFLGPGPAVYCNHVVQLHGRRSILNQVRSMVPLAPLSLLGRFEEKFETNTYLISYVIVKTFLSLELNTILKNK